MSPAESLPKARRKGGRRRLRGGLARVLADHRTPMGQALRREYRALVAGLGLAGDPLLLAEAGRVALLRLRADEAGRAWAEVVEQRRTGRGRRPSLRQLERSRRAAALDGDSARQAEDRLRALAAERGGGLTPSERLARVNAVVVKAGGRNA